MGDYLLSINNKEIFEFYKKTENSEITNILLKTIEKIWGKFFRIFKNGQK